MLFPQVNVDFGVEKLIPEFVNHLGASKWSTMVACGSAFVSGVLVVLLLEALIILFVVLRALEKRQPSLSTHTSSVTVESSENSVHFAIQGAVWVAALPPGDVKKMYTKREKALKEKAAVKEQKGEQENVLAKDKEKAKKDPLKDYIHVAPVYRYAKLQGRVLHLSHQGVKESILLEGCQITAVSGSPMPSRKWAKKYPIKLQNQTRNIYGGSRDCLLYLATGWQKEAWCGVLRASAATFEHDHDDWYVKVKNEYQEYVQRVERQFPFLGRSGSSLGRSAEEKAEKISKAEAGANKKKQLWKKLTRRSTIKQPNRDNKAGERASGEKASSEKASSDAEDGGSSKGGRLVSAGPSLKIPRSVSVDDLAIREPVGTSDETQRIARTSSVKSSYEISSSAPLERDPPEALASEFLERTLLYGNLLFARLFFDLYHSKAVCNRLRNVIQRQLAKVPSPSYIGKLNCTKLELGNSPPLAQNVRLLPSEADGGWGLEADLQYFGGAILTIETRIDVRDSNAREKGVVQGIEQTLAGAATADLLTRGLENIKTDFHIANDDGGIAGDQRNMGGTSTSARPADVRVPEEAVRKGWMHSSITNVKAMMSRVAEQVSQVPLALTIKVVQLKGTLQVRIKPPPSDRIWFSFTEMPNLELQPEPCIGDHKINSGPLGAFIVNQIKILIRDSMVYPLCEDLSFSWMVAEADNWIPRDVLPLAFVPEVPVEQSNGKEKEVRGAKLKREVSIDSRLPMVVSSGGGPSNSLPGTPFQRSREDFGSPPVSPPRLSLESLSLPVTQPSSSGREQPVKELTVPLLAQTQRDPGPEESESIVLDVAEQLDLSQVQGLSSSDSDTGSLKSEDVVLLDSQPGEVRVSKRGKIFTFGKKMGNRIEEKKRSVIGKMRDRSDRSERGDRSQQGSSRSRA